MAHFLSKKILFSVCVRSNHGLGVIPTIRNVLTFCGDCDDQI